MLAVTSLSLFAGCNSSGPTPTAVPATAPSKHVLSEAPADAKSVIEAKKSAVDGEEVTVVGRIGGSVTPFVAGRPTFTLVDTSLVPCNERAGDSCKTPWDYCCDTDQLPKAMVVVKIVDDSGAPVALDAKKDLGMKELQTIIVHGKAKRDDSGNLSILTPAVFIKK